MRSARSLLTCLVLTGVATAAVSAAPDARVVVSSKELDAVETLLRRGLQPMPADNQIVMLREENRLTLRIPARELFEPDNAHFKVQSAAALPWAAVAKALGRRYRLAAQINVYTDSIGGQEANRSFTLQRALALVAALQAVSIRTARIAAEGQGSSDELAGDDTPEGREHNRRVEVVFGLPQPGFPQPGPPSS